MTVSAGTSYVVSLEAESGDKKPVYDIIFGKIRGLIRSDGPRNGMKVRSPSMVMELGVQTSMSLLEGSLDKLKFLFSEVRSKSHKG